MSFEEGVAKSVCAACGEPFVCGAQAGLAHCWCMDQPPIVRAAEASATAGCYCARCLAQKISAQSSKAT